MSFSKTAYALAFQRYAHLVFDKKPFILEDKIIGRLLSENVKQKIRSEAEKYQSPLMVALRSHAVLRSRYAEDKIKESVKNGNSQVIILGAGLDTSSIRMGEQQERVHFYEIDKPESQQEKLRLLRSANIRIPNNVRFLPINFEIDNMKNRMTEAGIDQTKPAIFTWLGVTMYLTEEAIKTTLSECALFQEGSSIVFTFANKENSNTEIEESAARAGEKWYSKYSENEITELLFNAGFKKGIVVSPRELDLLYFQNRSDRLVNPVFSSLAIGIA